MNARRKTPAVNRYHHIGPYPDNILNHIADMAQNLRNTRNNLQQSHHRQIRNVKQRLQPFPFHGIAADAEKFDFAAGLFFQRPHQA